jgi:acylphosphatase
MRWRLDALWLDLRWSVRTLAKRPIAALAVVAILASAISVATVLGNFFAIVIYDAPPVGTVQGVEFRPWVYRMARQAGVTGRVHNDANGVTIEAFGDWDEIERFIALLHAAPPPAARVVDFHQTPIAAELVSEFVIDASEPSGISDTSSERRASIPPDLATCDACAAEIDDGDSRSSRPNGGSRPGSAFARSCK